MGLFPFWVYVGYPSKISRLYLYGACTKSWTCPGGMLHTHLFNKEREPMTDQCTGTIKTQTGEPMSFSGISYKEQKEFKDNCITKTHPRWMTNSKSWELGAPYTSPR